MRLRVRRSTSTAMTSATAATAAAPKSPSPPLLAVAGLLLVTLPSAAAAAGDDGAAPARNPTGDDGAGGLIGRWLRTSARRVYGHTMRNDDYDYYDDNDGGRRHRRLKSKKDEMGDDCWGWQDDWTDDEYSPCWDGTFPYVLDPNTPPDRCDEYDPSDPEDDDWYNVCGEWYATYSCAKEDEAAVECGADDDDDFTKGVCCDGYRCAEQTDDGFWGGGGGGMVCVEDAPTPSPTESCAVDGMEARECGGTGWDAADRCCDGFRCSADDDDDGNTGFCEEMPTCAEAGGRATSCGAGATQDDGKGLLFEYPSECCDGLVCAEGGLDGAEDGSCVVPPPPLECVDHASSFVYQTPSGFQRTAYCDVLIVGGDTTPLDTKCGNAVVGTASDLVMDYCPVTCGVCAPPTASSTTTAGPTTLAPTRSPSLPTDSPTMTLPTELPTAAPAAIPVPRDPSWVPISSFSMTLAFSTASRGRHRNLQTTAVDEDELKQKTADHLADALRQSFQDFSFIDLDMARVDEDVRGDSTIVLYDFSGNAGFVNADLSTPLPTAAQVDETVMRSFTEDDSFQTSLQTSTDPALASAAVVSVSESAGGAPAPGTRPPDSDAPPPQEGKSLPVGVIAGVASAVCVLCAVFAIGIYRRKRRVQKNESYYLRSPSGAPSKQCKHSPSTWSGSSRDSPVGKLKLKNNKYYEEMEVPDGASDFSGLSHNDKILVGYGTDQGGGAKESNALGPLRHDNDSIDDSYSYGGIGTSVGDDQSLANMSALGEVRLGKVLSLEDGLGGADRSIGGESEFNDVWKEGQESVASESDIGGDDAPTQLDYGAAVEGSVLYEGGRPATLEVIQDDSLEKYEEDDDE